MKIILKKIVLIETRLTICNSDKKLAKIIYIADKRDATRKIEDEVVDVAKKDLDKAVELLKEKFNKRKEFKVYDAIKEIIDNKFGEDLTILDFRNKMKKKYNAQINYKGKIFNMLVSGKNEESVRKDITDFFIKIFKDSDSFVKIELEEI